MKKILRTVFYFLLTGALCFFYNRYLYQEMDPFTGYFMGNTLWLYGFYGVLLLFMLGIFLLVPKEASPAQENRRVNLVLVFVSIVAGVLLAFDGVYRAWPDIISLPGTELAAMATYGFTLLGVVVSLLAAVSLFFLAVGLLGKNDGRFYFSKMLLFLVVWQTVRLIVRFSQLPMAFRMPQYLFEVLYLVMQCVFFLESCHLLCGVTKKHSYKYALFFGFGAFVLGALWLVGPVQSWAGLAESFTTATAVEWILWLFALPLMHYLAKHTKPYI